MPVLIPSGRRARSRRLPTLGPSDPKPRSQAKPARPMAGGKAIRKIGEKKKEQRNAADMRNTVGPRLMLRFPRLPR